MHRLFGEIQPFEDAYERRQNAARFRSVKSLNRPAALSGHRESERERSDRLTSRYIYSFAQHQKG